MKFEDFLLDYINDLRYQVDTLQYKLTGYELVEKRLKKGIESTIYQIEHNPRLTAKNRDKSIVKQLNDLLNGGK